MLASATRESRSRTSTSNATAVTYGIKPKTGKSEYQFNHGPRSTNPSTIGNTQIARGLRTVQSRFGCVPYKAIRLVQSISAALRASSQVRGTLQSAQVFLGWVKFNHKEEDAQRLELNPIYHSVLIEIGTWKFGSRFSRCASNHQRWLGNRRRQEDHVQNPERFQT